jgi:predicted enzyme related to lactoylglutathione lyase
MAFYQQVFGWEFPKWMEAPPYWGVMTAPQGSTEPGINGGLMRRMGGDPAAGAAVNAYVCTVQVDSFDATHERIMKAGGTVALPKFALTGLAWQGYYHDPEGNIFGVHEPDPNAK